MPAAAELDTIRCPRLAELIRVLDALSDRPDLDLLRRLLERAEVTRGSFGPLCRFDERSYRRNLIARSDHYELLCVCWRSGHCTPIHDHRGSACAFRVVEGVGTEVQFELSPSGLVRPTRTTRMGAGYICASQDADIHTVINMERPGEDLITMHIYTPPLERIHTYRFPEPDLEACCQAGAAGVFD